MSDPLAHVRPNDPLVITAETFNLLIDAAREARKGPRLGAGPNVRDPLTPALEVYVRNSTGATLLPFSVVKPSATPPEIDPEPFPFKARRTPLLDVVLPTGAADQVLITIEYVAPGKIGRAVISGCVVARVNVTNAAHRFAAPAAGDFSALQSQAAPGPAILFAPDGVGVYRTLVILGDPPAAGGGGGITVRESDGTDAVPGASVIEFPVNTIQIPAAGIARLLHATPANGGTLSDGSQRIKGPKQWMGDATFEGSVNVNAADAGLEPIFSIASGASNPAGSLTVNRNGRYYFGPVDPGQPGNSIPGVNSCFIVIAGNQRVRGLVTTYALDDLATLEKINTRVVADVPGNFGGNYARYVFDNYGQSHNPPEGAVDIFPAPFPGDPGVPGFVRVPALGEFRVGTARGHTITTGGATFTGGILTAGSITGGGGGGVGPDSVGPTELIATGVAAGSYTNANITVDSDGRITAAANGTAGGGITQLTGSVLAGPGSGSQVATIAPSGVTPGTYIRANISVDADGRVTLAANGPSATSALEDVASSTYTLLTTPTVVAQLSLTAGTWVLTGCFHSDLLCSSASGVHFFQLFNNNTSMIHSRGSHIAPVNVRSATGVTLQARVVVGAGATHVYQLLAYRNNGTYSVSTVAAESSLVAIKIS